MYTKIYIVFMNIELAWTFYLVEKEFEVFIKMPLFSFGHYFLVPFLSHNVQMDGNCNKNTTVKSVLNCAVIFINSPCCEIEFIFSRIERKKWWEARDNFSLKFLTQTSSHLSTRSWNIAILHAIYKISTS